MPNISARLRRDAEAIAVALSRSEAIVEFDLDGRIIGSNKNFCLAFGYAQDEIVGKHHSILCEGDYASSDTYRRFWENLGRGRFEAGEYICLGREGRKMRVHVSYNPLIFRGKPYKIVKFARVFAADTPGGIKALAEMDRLSQEFGARISVIDRAAFHTNLLALEQWCRTEAAG
jgi:PAS domain S-box-containing protein